MGAFAAIINFTILFFYFGCIDFDTTHLLPYLYFYVATANENSVALNFYYLYFLSKSSNRTTELMLDEF